MPRTYQLRRVQVIPRPRAEVFTYFSDAQNLKALTPRFLDLQILNRQPIEMRAGTLIDYRLKLFVVPLKWRTEITICEPPCCFVDEQLRGPYQLWRHRHEFLEIPTGTLMTDTVDYQLPLGPLGTLAHGLFVHRTLNRIFDYRHQAVQRIFGSSQRPVTQTAAE